MSIPEPSASDPRSLASRGWALAAGFAMLAGLVAVSAWLRTHAALHDPNFDVNNAVGLLRSDPALLYYFVERILEAGGGLPDDFRADPRVLHPATTDVLAVFPLGIEWIVAWCRGLFAADMPLHVVCVRVAAVCAASTAAGVYGLALELTRRVRWAVLAAALWVVTSANYRTVGFVLMGEDASLPLFALHLYLFARACRLRTHMSIALAALALVLAASTWHALGFFVLLEAAAVFAWYTQSGENALGSPRAWIGLAVAGAAACAIPILRSTHFAVSLPLIVALALYVVARAQSRHAWSRRRTWCVCAALIAVGAVCSITFARLSGGGLADYGHVWALVAQKLAHGGQLPADPLELPAEVRLMWQGPFATAPLFPLLASLGLGLVFALAFLLAPRAGTRTAADAPGAVVSTGGARTVLAWLLAFALPAAWLIERTVIFAGVLVPVAAVCAAQGLVTHWSGRSARWLPLTLVAGCTLLQGSWTYARFEHFESGWYFPRERQLEIRALVRAIRELVPEREAIASDFVNSTAILAHTRRPIVLQPKYEDRESRERAIEFFEAFYHGRPDDLRRLLAVKYRCRYLVVDRNLFGELNAALYLGGIQPAGARPEPGTCWALFGSQDPRVLVSVPGFELLYRSPPTIRRGGDATDFFRLYRLAP